MSEDEDRQLGEASKALKEARAHLNRCLVRCSVYVAQQAATDPDAAELHRLTTVAFDSSTAAGVAAATTVDEIARSAD